MAIKTGSDDAILPTAAVAVPKWVFFVAVGAAAPSPVSIVLEASSTPSRIIQLKLHLFGKVGLRNCHNPSHVSGYSQLNCRRSELLHFWTMLLWKIGSFDGDLINIIFACKKGQFECNTWLYLATLIIISKHIREEVNVYCVDTGERRTFNWTLEGLLSRREDNAIFWFCFSSAISNIENIAFVVVCCVVAVASSSSSSHVASDRCHALSTANKRYQLVLHLYGRAHFWLCRYYNCHKYSFMINQINCVLYTNLYLKGN